MWLKNDFSTRLFFKLCVYTLINKDTCQVSLCVQQTRSADCVIWRFGCSKDKSKSILSEAKARVNHTRPPVNEMGDGRCAAPHQNGTFERGKGPACVAVWDGGVGECSGGGLIAFGLGNESEAQVSHAREMRSWGESFNLIQSHVIINFVNWNIS